MWNSWFILLNIVTRMKQILWVVMLGVILSSFVSSCSIEKRQHLKGYHIDFRKPQKKEQLAEKTDRNTREAEPKVEVMPKPDRKLWLSSASDDLSTVLEARPMTPEFFEPEENDMDSVRCDRITFKDGEEIPASVLRVQGSYIYYRKCPGNAKEELVLNKSEVFMIVYSDGTKQVFEKQEASKQPDKSATEEEESENAEAMSIILGLLSLVAGGLSLLLFFTIIFGILFGLVGLGLGIGAMMLGRKGTTSTGKILGVIGLIISVLGLLISIIWLPVLIAITF